MKYNSHLLKGFINIIILNCIVEERFVVGIKARLSLILTRIQCYKTWTQGKDKY